MTICGILLSAQYLDNEHFDSRFMHNSRQCTGRWKRFKGRVQSWEEQMFVTRDERGEGGGGVGVTFFRSGRTRLEFTAIRVHNGRALGLDQVQRSTEFLRFNAFILAPTPFYTSYSSTSLLLSPSPTLLRYSSPPFFLQYFIKLLRRWSSRKCTV